MLVCRHESAMPTPAARGALTPEGARGWANSGRTQKPAFCPSSFATLAGGNVIIYKRKDLAFCLFLLDFSESQRKSFVCFFQKMWEYQLSRQTSASQEHLLREGFPKSLHNHASYHWWLWPFSHVWISSSRKLTSASSWQPDSSLCCLVFYLF